MARISAGGRSHRRLRDPRSSRTRTSSGPRLLRVGRQGSSHVLAQLGVGHVVELGRGDGPVGDRQRLAELQGQVGGDLGPGERHIVEAVRGTSRSAPAVRVGHEAEPAMLGQRALIQHRDQPGADRLRPGVEPRRRGDQVQQPAVARHRVRDVRDAGHGVRDQLGQDGAGALGELRRGSRVVCGHRSRARDRAGRSRSRSLHLDEQFEHTSDTRQGPRQPLTTDSRTARRPERRRSCARSLER
jgi:hypothetical protein